jgi:hypothetical protein
MVDSAEYVSSEKMPKKRKHSSYNKERSSKKRHKHEKAGSIKYSDSIPSTIQIASDYQNMSPMQPEQSFSSSVVHLPRGDSDQKMAAKGVSQTSLLSLLSSSKEHRKQSMKHWEHGERHRDSKKKSRRSIIDDVSQLPIGPDQVFAYRVADGHAPIMFQDTNQKPSANADSFKKAAGFVSATGGSTSVCPSNNNRSMMNDATLVDRDPQNSKRRPAAAKPSHDNSNDDDDDDKYTKKRLLVWSDLLGERPSRKDDDSMAKWLMNVLAVSDRSKVPFNGEGASSI